jgi:hypothetical protein
VGFFADAAEVDDDLVGDFVGAFASATNSVGHESAQKDTKSGTTKRIEGNELFIKKVVHERGARREEGILYLR